MSNFDFNLHKIVGIARKKYSTHSHARVSIMGYIDNSWHYIPFQDNELQDIFNNEGYVHYSNALDKYCDRLISFNIIETEGYNEDPKITRFKVNYNGMDYYDHTPVINISKVDLPEAVELNGYDKYYKVGSRIYKLTKSDRKKGIAKYWQLTDDFLYRNKNYICKNDEDVFIIADEINDTLFSYGEMLSKPEIVNFVVDIISKYNIDPKNFKSIPDGLINMLDIPAKILQFRFEEFNNVLEYITLSHNQIMKIAINPLLVDVLQRSISEYEDEYIKTYEGHHRELLKKIDQSKEQKLEEITKECEEKRKIHLERLKSITGNIEEANVRLNEINAKIHKKEEEAKALELRFADIEEHKGRLIEDFAVIKDVIGGKVNTPHQSQRNCIEIVNCDGESITEFTEFRNYLFAHLINNRFQEDSAKEIAKELSTLFFAQNHIGKNMSVILLPNLKIFKSLIDTVGQYKLCSIGVVPNWKSYDDLYQNGFGEMVISARNNPDEIHLVLLQNMNLSYIPSYMQPINDILIGISNNLPGYNDCIGIPTNLWIFGTRTGLNEEAIPISLSNIEEYGCIKNKEYTYSKDIKAEVPKYRSITMDFVNIQREEEYLYDEIPDSYID